MPSFYGYDLVFFWIPFFIIIGCRLTAYRMLKKYYIKEEMIGLKGLDSEKNYKYVGTSKVIPVVVKTLGYLVTFFTLFIIFYAIFLRIVLSGGDI